VKAVSDLYAPISGKVVEINKALVDKPDMINTDPYGQAWMLIVEPTNLSELDALLDATAYTALTGEAQS
jgi:glycine cleavage system H protein